MTAAPHLTPVPDHPGAPDVNRDAGNGGRPHGDRDNALPGLGHEPPHDLDAERLTIGACFISGQVADELTATLDTSVFYRPGHATIWDAIQATRAPGEPADPITVNARLAAAGQSAATGHNPMYLSDLIAAVPVARAALHHGQHLTDLRRRRTVIERATTLLARAQAPDADADEIVYAQLAWFEEAITEAEHAGRDTSWAALDLDAALTGSELDPPPSILPRTDGACLLYAGAVHTLAGEPGCGKTWIALQAAVVELQAGHGVVYVDFEDRATRVVGRLLQLGAKPDQILDHFHYVRPHEALDHRGRGALGAHLPHATLAVLDGVTEAMTLHGLDLSANPDVAQFYALLPRWIADRGPAVVLIDHVIKDDDKRGKWSIGGQHKLAGLDGAAYQVKAIEPFGRGKRGTAVVTVAKDRPGYIEEFALGRAVGHFTLDARGDVTTATLAPPTSSASGGDGHFEPTHIMEKVSRFIEAHPGASKNMVEGAVKGKATVIRLALELLTDGEYVAAERGARGAVAYTSAIAYRESGDPE